MGNQQWATSRGFELRDIPMPALDESRDSADANHVIIKIRYAGVCGTDRGIWYRRAFRNQIEESISEQDIHKQYRIMGHEFFGEIIARGSSVGNVNIGDSVTCESHVICNQCYQCVRGETHVCMNEKILGISTDGGFAEFVKVPAHIIWKTDISKIRQEIAAVQEPFGNAVHAASKVDLKGKTVAIFGLGPIGMFLTLIAKASGAKMVIGVEPNVGSAEMARKLGIDHIIFLKSNGENGITGTAKDYAHNAEVTDEIMRMTNGVGVDVSFEMAGFNSSVNNCLYATRRGGDIVLFGIKNGDVTLEDYNRIIVRGYTLHCVIGRHIWKTWETVRGILEDKSNGIQEKIFNVILNGGIDTIIPIAEYTKEVFETKMVAHPKILIQF